MMVARRRQRYFALPKKEGGCPYSNDKSSFSFDSPFPPPFRRKRESRPMSRERRNENGNSVPCVPGKCSHEQVLAQGSQSTGGMGPRAVENGVDLGA